MILGASEKHLGSAFANGIILGAWRFLVHFQGTGIGNSLAASIQTNA
jgi:hypothetical protein